MKFALCLSFVLLGIAYGSPVPDTLDSLELRNGGHPSGSKPYHKSHPSTWKPSSDHHKPNNGGYNKNGHYNKYGRGENSHNGKGNDGKKNDGKKHEDGKHSDNKHDGKTNDGKDNHGNGNKDKDNKGKEKSGKGDHGDGGY